MIIPNAIFGDKSKFWREEDYEDNPEHRQLRDRLCKTLYYGKMPTMDRPSLAMTELAVEVLQDVAPKELGRVDMDWAAAVTREAVITPTSLILGMTYAKRLKKKNSAYRYRQQISSSDLFLVSVMMASKFLYDEGEEDGVVNEEWAQSANLGVDELNELERNFLAAMDWELFVRNEEFWTALAAIEQQVAWRQGRKRGGSLTYTDLNILAAPGLCTPLQRLLMELCKVVAVCTVAYVACLAVLLAAQPAVQLSLSLAPRLTPTPQASEFPAIISSPGIAMPEMSPDNSWSSSVELINIIALSNTIITAVSWVLPAQTVISRGQQCTVSSVRSSQCHCNSSSRSNSSRCTADDDGVIFRDEISDEEQLNSEDCLHTVSPEDDDALSCNRIPGHGNFLVSSNNGEFMSPSSFSSSAKSSLPDNDQILAATILHNRSDASEILFGFQSAVEVA